MSRGKSITITMWVCMLTGLFLYNTAYAGDCDEWVAKIVSVQGEVKAKKAGTTEWTPAKLNDTFCPGDMLRVHQRSRAAVILSNESVTRLNQNTSVTFKEVEEEKVSFIDVIKGAVHFFSRMPRSLKFSTPFVNGAVEGTEFFVEVGDDQTLISVFRGRVVAANDAGSINLANGQAAIARSGKAPMAHLVVNPRDAVQWAVYYPAVIDYKVADFEGNADTWQGKVRKSIQYYRDGDLVNAFSSLEGVPETVSDARLFTYRAGLLLTVGRVDEADADINKALNLDEGNGNALALQSIIAVTQNRKAEAMDLANKAVAQDSGSSSAKVALSYAQQASFNVEGALESLQDAVALSPEDALARARLSELWMSVGDLDKALEEAQKAATLNPNLARTQTVLGFAHLAQIKTMDAMEAFNKAIELDQAAPLPRLGLGLAKIREGDLKPGRAEIEIAAGLDPNNSLIRSYLGKAFFDEKRDKQSNSQLAIAKELDPNDPTPYFYDAIRKQTLNRPVEALQDLQKSIELNDNRAVYRSQLLLDEDLAARSASLGRIYRDLGFQELALNEGYKSLNTDPSSYSAHRLLADSYSALPRHEIARVSELLQSQLMQPINITPVQPSMAESNLYILEGAGPADPSFNEFNSLFLRNRLALQASGVVGGDSTYGDEIIQSGVWGRMSYSVGQFHYQTDGFRENNDQDRDIYNVFVQTALSHKTSIQAEYRYENSEKGDFPLRFDPEDILKDWRESTDAYSVRFGFRHAFSRDSDVIGSFIYRDQEDSLEDKKAVFDIDFYGELEGFNAELQHIFRSERVNITSGAGYFDRDDKVVLAFIPSPFPPGADKYDTEHTNLYVYSLINYPENVVWTVGASGEFYEGGELDTELDKFNPKFGFTWELNETTTLRGAVFRTLKRDLVSNQTLEPTQIAGFNQFFDDGDGTEAWRYGIAIDQKFAGNVYGGIECSYRDMDVPFQDINLVGPPVTVINEADWEERLGRAYLYWTPHDWMAGSVEFQYERLDRDKELTAGIKNVETYRVPVGINFYHPSGFSIRLKATYIDQEGDFWPQDSFPWDPFLAGGDDFCVVDGSVSYRLPERYGIISLDAKNLFDKSFKYYDTDPVRPYIQPESLVLIRFTLVF